MPLKHEHKTVKVQKQREKANTSCDIRFLFLRVDTNLFIRFGEIKMAVFDEKRIIVGGA